MQQILYTQEGSKYIIKTANKFSVISLAAPENVQIFAMIKPDGNFPPDYYNLVVNTSKKIIPIGFTFSVIESGVFPHADISSVFCYIQYNAGSTPRPPSNTTYLSKMAPYVYTDYFTNNNYYAYRYKYKDIIYSDSDFTETSNSINIFTSTQQGAMTGLGAPTDIITVPIGSHHVMLTFTYFEMI
jgi:hypothetical protein